VTVAIPGYIDRFLADIAKTIGRTKETVALFFLSQEVEYTQQHPLFEKDP